MCHELPFMQNDMTLSYTGQPHPAAKQQSSKESLPVPTMMDLCGVNCACGLSLMRSSFLDAVGSIEEDVFQLISQFQLPHWSLPHTTLHLGGVRQTDTNAPWRQNRMVSYPHLQRVTSRHHQSHTRAKSKHNQVHGGVCARRYCIRSPYAYRCGGTDLELIGSACRLEVSGRRHSRQQRGNRLLAEVPFGESKRQRRREGSVNQRGVEF